MAEILFILVTVYAVYVVQSVITSNKTKQAEKNPAKKTQEKAKVVDNTKNSVTDKEKPVVKKDSVQRKKAKKEVGKKEKIAEKNTKMPAGKLRDPVTGEEATIASSYRMLRRWIKEALVKEGLVDKIYKTNELDDAAVEKINIAIGKLKKIEKYQ
ncbi:MAG: hypothetical protein L3J59_10885 [Methylococcaceae bacterium]|nr:hypothetical protein [Methylococcaceae bacterium]